MSVDTGGFVRAMVGGRDWEADDGFARLNFAVGVDGEGVDEDGEEDESEDLGLSASAPFL